MSRFAIGDIHGCYEPLKTYFNENPMNDDTAYIFLGDYIEYEVVLDDGQNLIINEYTKDTSEVHKDNEKVFISFDPYKISLYAADTEEVISK